MKSGESNQLCFECGLCCNGVIFADVQLQPGDDAERLHARGLSFAGSTGARPAGRKSNLKSKTTRLKFLQPCAAFDGCRCRIYADRPGYCRGFECLTLKQLKAERLEKKTALNIVREAVRRSEKVKGLLRELGDQDEHLALSRRFRRVKQRLESDVPDEATADLFSRLSLAVHDLNLLLRDAFYPGD
jgi:Fe-S-cluster containining protein